MSSHRGRDSGPPRFVRLLVRLLLPEEEREFYLGDLEEGARGRWLRELAGAAVMRLSRRTPRGSTVANRIAPRRPASLVSHFLGDLRLGARQLARTPGATLTALIALSVGIGLSGMMFSLIRGGLLPTLPVPNGERVVRVQHEDYSPTPPEMYEYWSERQRSFEGLGISATRPVSLIIDGVGGGPVRSAAIDVGTLPLLSIEPVIGRGLSETDVIPGAPSVVLIGYDLWESRMDSDPDVLGRTVRLNGAPADIIGVMPEGFGFPFSHELWIPLDLSSFQPENRNESTFVFGLLREGVANAAAAAELNDLALERPRSASDLEPPPVRVLAYTNIVSPSQVTYILAGLMTGVALLVLLVACANVTNVLLARAAVRAREVAVRGALGASRLRIAMQFWIEATVLAVAGAAGGAVLARVGVSIVRNAANIPGMPFWFDLRVDLPVLLFIAISAVLAAMAAGVLPAMHATRADGHELLKDASRGTSSRRLGKLMGRLVGAELTVSFVLLVASGLFIRSAINLDRHEFGFGPEGVYTANARLPDTTYENLEDRLAFMEELEERLASIPGASSATLATVLPGIGHRRVRVAIEGTHDPTAADLPQTGLAAVSPGFFETYRAPLLAGRAFDAGDRLGELPVAVVNAALQQTHLPEGAVGRRIALPDEDGTEEWYTIVGVAPDHLAPGLDPELPLNVVYLPLAQVPPIAFDIAVRSAGDVAAMAAPIREVAVDLDPDVAIYFMRALEEAIASANASFVWMSALFFVAGVLALFLAAIGLYGVMAFWVSQRTREIGVRMAVGGAGSRIVGFVLGQGLRKIVLGLLVGALLSLPVGWGLRGALLDVSPFDPGVFGTVLGVLLLAGALGCVLPAMRATRVDPQTVLSAE